MPDISWRKGIAALAIIALAALTAASLFYVWSQKAELDRSYQDYQSKAAEKQDNAADKAADYCKGIIARGPLLKCAVNQLKAYNQQDSRDQDLKAQQDMAFWAEWLFYVTVIFGSVGAVLTIIGIWYVRNTLLEIRRIGEAEIRAYISCLGGNFEFDPQKLIINVKLKNTGQSPTSPIKMKLLSIFTLETFLTLTLSSHFPQR